MKHYLLLLSLFFRIHSSVTLPPKNLPNIEDKCPKEFELVDYCSSEHDSCNDFQIPRSTCSARLERCISSRKVNDAECNRYMEQFLRNARNPNSSMEDEGPNGIVSRWSDSIRNATDSMKDCAPVRKSNGSDFEQTVQNIQWLNSVISNTTCTDSKLSFDEFLILSDQVPSLQHFVPFDRFRCGWSLGYIGKVYLRQVISWSCGISTIKINHCCATHMNCHLLEKGDLNQCDQQFVDCQQKVITTMLIWKTTCQKYNKESVRALPLMLEGSKQIRGQKIHTKVDVSTERFQLSITSSEIAKFESTRVSFFKLGSDLKTPRAILKYFNEDILRHGWNKRIIIDSCGMMFENSVQYDENGTSYRKLTTCLNDIDNKTEEFENAVSELDKLAMKHLEQEVTMDRLAKMIEDKIERFHLKLVIEYLVFTFLTYLLVLASPKLKAFLRYISTSIWERCRNTLTSKSKNCKNQPPAERENGEESIPMTEFRRED